MTVHVVVKEMWGICDEREVARLAIGGERRVRIHVKRLLLLRFAGSELYSLELCW